MQKIKVFLFAAAVLSLFSLGNETVFAVESEEIVEKVVEKDEETAKNIATFKADDEDSELGKSIEALRAELAEMKSGMSALQAKIMENEMSQLRAQLINLQNELLTNSVIKKPEESTADSEEDKYEPYFEPLDESSDSENEPDSDANPETADSPTETENEIEFYEEDDLAAKLALAEAEIAKLKTENGTENTEKIYEKIENELAVEIEIDESEPVDVGEKMAEAGEDAEKIAGKKDESKPASIIAKADGDLLFQFPRSFSSKKMSATTVKSIGAKNLMANTLVEKNDTPAAPNFTRSSAPAKKIELFSARNIAILAILIIVAMGTFIYFLVKNERKLLTSHSNIFPKNDFPLAKSARKILSPRNGSTNKKIIE